MGSFFIDLLSFDHEVAVYEKDAKRLRFTYNCLRFTKLEEIAEFKPELVINAVTVKYTLPAFEEVLPWLPKDCIISGAEGVIEFSHPAAVMGNIKALLPLGLPIVVGTTGWNDRHDEVNKLAAECGGTIMTSSNFSIGVNMH